MGANTTLSFSVISGKGGVGKSNLALNISYCLNLMGQRTLLIDCDMGLANMDVLLGITPRFHIQDILLGNCDAAEVLVPVGPTPGLDLMPANSGLAEFSELNQIASEILREKILPLTMTYDYVCLDVGAGISSTALALSASTAMRLVIITPEPTSLTDSYAMMKVLKTRYGIKDFHIIVNQVESKTEAMQTYNRITAVCQRFLDFAPTMLGSISNDRALSDAVRKQKPLMQLSPRSPAAADCMAAAQHLHRMRETLVSQNKLPLPLAPAGITNAVPPTAPE